MNSISKDDLNHIAKLSSLPLKDGEAEKFSKLLSDTISYVNVLNELDTTQVLKTNQVTGLTNVFQKNDENAVINLRKNVTAEIKLINDNFLSSLYNL